MIALWMMVVVNYSNSDIKNLKTFHYLIIFLPFDSYLPNASKCFVSNNVNSFLITKILCMV